MVVRAEFQTKKPKPAKGMQTHKPVIYRDDLVDMPMMMIDNGLLVHAAFEDNTAVVVGLQTCDNTQTKCPELAKAHAKSKYKKYHIHECWLPVDAKVTLLGTVVSINENCVTLSGSALKSQPSILFNGVQSALKRRFLRHMKYALIPLSWATLSAVSMWTWLPWSMEFPLMIVACIGIYFVARKFHHIKPEF